MVRLFLYLSILVVTVSLTKSPALAEGFLNKAELVKFLTGRVVDSNGRDGVSMIQEFKAGGELTTEFDRPGNRHSWTTKWWTKGKDIFCFENHKEKTFCNKIKKTADGYKRFNPRGEEIRSYWKPRM